MLTVRVPKSARLILLFGGLICFLPQALALAQSSADFHEVRRVTGLAPASIQAFDISPDGKLLAVLSQSESPREGWSRLVVQDVETGRTVMDLKLNTGPRPDIQQLPPWYLPHVRFSADQRFLVVQDWQNVRVASLSNSQVESTFTSASAELNVPFSILGAANNDLFLVSYGTNLPSNWGNKGFNDLVNPHVHNELVDISTGERKSSWASDDIPQSLSPDGKFAAVSDWDGDTPLVEIEIVDAGTGKEITTLRSGYKFKKPWAPGVAGRVLAKFLSADEILLSPDEHVDSTGHKSGDSIKIVRVPDGRLIRVIKPDDFGPMGEMATSAGGNCFVAVNWYISPRYAKRDAVPDSLPELLVFPDLGKGRNEKISELSLDAPITGEALRGFSPRVSNDASVVALAEGGAVVVFLRN
jgi:hypothetical protein